MEKMKEGEKSIQYSTFNGARARAVEILKGCHLKNEKKKLQCACCVVLQNVLSKTD